MDLTLGRRADYAVRALLDLARHADTDGRRKAREIGREMSVPATYLPQILAQLAHAGLVTSVAGPNGGYSLARPPQDISLFDAIMAVEGDPASKVCVLRGGPCRWEEYCAVHVPWARAQDALMGELKRTSFAEVAVIDAAIEAGTHEPPAVARRTVVDG